MYEPFSYKCSTHFAAHLTHLNTTVLPPSDSLALLFSATIISLIRYHSCAIFCAVHFCVTVVQRQLLCEEGLFCWKAHGYKQWLAKACTGDTARPRAMELSYFWVNMYFLTAKHNVKTN